MRLFSVQLKTVGPESFRSVGKNGHTRSASCAHRLSCISHGRPVACLHPENDFPSLLLSAVRAGCCHWLGGTVGRKAATHSCGALAAEEKRACPQSCEMQTKVGLTLEHIRFPNNTRLHHPKAPAIGPAFADLGRVTVPCGHPVSDPAERSLANRLSQRGLVGRGIRL